MSDFSSAPTSGGIVRPHRGALILVFGILGLVVCFPFGIAAWLMGSSDIKSMDRGEVDPEGRGLTQAGVIIGIVATVLNLIGILLGGAFMIIGLLAAAANN